MESPTRMVRALAVRVPLPRSRNRKVRADIRLATIRMSIRMTTRRMELSVGDGVQSKPAARGRPWLVGGLPVVAGLVVCLAGVQLGNWQMRRAEEKTRLGERVARLSVKGGGLRQPPGRSSLKL